MSEQLLNSKKEKAKNVLEVGILNGGSIKLWSDYLTNINVDGIDGPHTLQSMEQFIKLYSQRMTDDGIDMVRTDKMGEYRLMKYMKNKGWRSVQCPFTSEMFNASH